MRVGIPIILTVDSVNLAVVFNDRNLHAKYDDNSALGWLIDEATNLDQM